ncbi:Glycosyltransferase family 31 protein [Mycena kentingensis (nom. inval.)]|nr:Glycosyltransferase family 31 protein [Mycena kentingensis (nom. inval.)]
MTSTLPKATLYYSEHDWRSSAVLVALREKGYAPDELTMRIVDRSKAENMLLPYLRISSSLGTTPTLVVPFKDTIADDPKYKALTDPKAIIDFLDQSRSPMSRTRTTTTNPAPVLRPATVAFATTTSALLDIIYAEDISPDHLALLNARDHASLMVLAKNKVQVLATIQKTLAHCLSDADAGTVQASEKVRNLWRGKLAETDSLLAVLRAANKDDAALNATEQKQRAEYFAKANAAWDKVKDACLALNKDIIGPYALGEQYSIADISLGAWLSAITELVDGTGSGAEKIGKLEAHVGGGFVLAKEVEGKSKLAVLLQNIEGRV